MMTDCSLVEWTLKKIFGTGDTEGEWAVEHICLHSGSRHDASFEIEWKLGDITWLPYYQITHSQALTDYLDLLGITQISQLCQGAGQPLLRLQTI